MDRTELFLAIIAYTLIAGVVLPDGSDAFWFAYLPLYVLLVALPIYVVVDILRNNQLLD